MRSSFRPLAATSALLLVAFSVSACTEERPTPTASPSSTPSSSPSPEPSETPTPEPEPQGIPVNLTCDQIITPEAMYEYNSNFALLAEYSPEPGTTAAGIVENRGISCRWQNLTSGETLDVSVAQFPEEPLTAIKNELVMTSNSVPTYEVEGYFDLDGPLGIADAFSDPYWIHATSAAFLEPGDAYPIVVEAIANLS